MGSLRTRYLVRRRDTYYFRKWVPRRHARLLGVLEVKVSLKTTDPTLAKKRALLAELLLIGLLDEVDTMTQENRQSEAHIRTLLNAYFLKLKSSFKDDYERNLLNPELDIEGQVAGLGDLAQDLRCRAGSGDYPQWAYETAHSLSSDGETDFTELPELLQGRLTRGVMQAMAENYNLMRGRYRGELDEFQFNATLNRDNDTPDKPSQQVTLGQAIKDYMAAKNYPQKTKMDYDRVLNWAKELLGQDLSLDTMTKDHVARYRDFLLKVPRNYKKHKELMKLTALDIAQMGSLILPAISDRTANKYLSMFKTFLHWCYAEEFIDSVPGTKITIQVKGDPSESRNPFSKKDLQTIFSAPVYTGCKSLGRRHDPGDLILKDGCYWIPLTALFTGMRAGEIIQLHVADIKCDDGIDFFDVTCLDGEEGKKLKTAQSKRKIPIHPQLIELGFLSYVEDRKKLKTDTKRLFHDISVGPNGDYSRNFSKWFGRFLNRAGAKTAKTCLHSCRHSFKDALANAEVEDSLQDALMGHLDKKQAKHIYGSQGKPLPALAKAIAKIDYKLDLSHLLNAQASSQSSKNQGGFHAVSI